MIAVILFGASCLICFVDLWLKQYAESNIKKGEEKELLQGRLLVRRVHNEGFIFNAFDNHPQFVHLASAGLGVILTVCQMVLLLRKGKRLKKTGVSLMAGGAWSNIYDRLVRKYVVDYFGFRTKWKKLTEITFNLGDIFIFLGSFLIAADALLRKRK